MQIAPNILGGVSRPSSLFMGVSGCRVSSWNSCGHCTDRI